MDEWGGGVGGGTSLIAIGPNQPLKPPTVERRRSFSQYLRSLRILRCTRRDDVQEENACRGRQERLAPEGRGARHLRTNEEGAGG